MIIVKSCVASGVAVSSLIAVVSVPFAKSFRVAVKLYGPSSARGLLTAWEVLVAGAL